MINVEDHLGLVRYLTVKTLGKFDEDAYQEGCLELVLASRRFDESKGIKFSTYAAPCIISHIKSWKAHENIVKLNKTKRKDYGYGNLINANM